MSTKHVILGILMSLIGFLAMPIAYACDCDCSRELSYEERHKIALLYLNELDNAFAGTVIKIEPLDTVEFVSLAELDANPDINASDNSTKFAQVTFQIDRRIKSETPDYATIVYAFGGRWSCHGHPFNLNLNLGDSEKVVSVKRGKVSQAVTDSCNCYRDYVFEGSDVTTPIP